MCLMSCTRDASINYVLIDLGWPDSGTTMSTQAHGETSVKLLGEVEVQCSKYDKIVVPNVVGCLIWFPTIQPKMVVIVAKSIPLFTFNIVIPQSIPLILISHRWMHEIIVFI